MPTPVPGLADKVEEVIEAAINAEMNESGWYGSCDDGFHVTARATEANPIPRTSSSRTPTARCWPTAIIPMTP